MTEDFDFSKFQQDEADSYLELVDSKDSFPKIVYDLLNHFIYYPNETLKLMLLAYALCPSALSKRLPLMFLYGVSGSGKSTAGKFVAKLRGKAVLSSSDTFASLRNFLESSKWKGGIERNCILVWDDLDPSVLIEKQDIFRLLKVGYDRQTQYISISGRDAGTNMTFATFSPKLISSIHPIWSYPKLNELERRSLVISHKKVNDEVELQDLDSFSFFPLSDEYEKFWSSEVACKIFLDSRKRFIRKRFDWIASDDKQLVADLVATVAVLDYFEDDTALYHWLESYWLNHLMPIRQKSSLAFSELLKEFIGKHQELEKKVNDSIPIDPKILLREAKNWASEGKIETYISPSILGDYMGKLGYKLSKNGWERLEV